MKTRDIEILIVEDEPLVQNILKFVVENEGYKVTVASNGRQALDRVASRHFEVILSDIKMPELDGFGMLANLPEVHPPVIFLTAFNDISEDDATSRGALALLHKPISPADLAQTLNQVLQAK